jgi:two-component system, OmpR family, response regulator ChvI
MAKAPRSTSRCPSTSILDEPDVASQDPDGGAADDRKTRRKAASRPHVLFVDDDEDVANVMSNGLKIQGYDVDAFADPNAALAQFSSSHYDFVVTDIKMPVMDGLELYAKIRERDAKVRFYFLSAYERFEQQVKEEFPADPLLTFLRKPITYRALAERLV